MIFRCRTNDPHYTGTEWYPMVGKPSKLWVQMQDGYVMAHAKFNATATDETIIRSYLRGYMFGTEEDSDLFNTDWTEFSMQRAFGPDQRVVNFYVKLSPDGRWATVTDQVPVGEMRADGFRY